MIENTVKELAEEHKQKNANLITEFLEFVADNAFQYDTDNGWDWSDLMELAGMFCGMEEHNNGWIAYTTNGELPKEGQRVWLSFTNEVASYVKDAWWQGKFFVWNNCHIVKDTPMAWKTYDIPAPYQPKGEKF